MKKEISLKLSPNPTKREYFAELVYDGDIIYTGLGALGMSLGAFVLLALFLNDMPWAQKFLETDRQLFSALGIFYLVSLIVTFFLSYNAEIKRNKKSNALDIKLFESILQFFPQSIDYLLDLNGKYYPKFWVTGTKYPLSNNLKVIFNYNRITFITPDYDIIFNLEERRVIMDDIVTNNFTKDEIHILMMRLDAEILSLGKRVEQANTRNYQKNIDNLKNMLK